MAINLQLLTNLSTIDQLHKLADSAAKKVSIDPEILRNILIDHAVMFRALSEDSRFKVKEPRYREKL